MIHENERSQAAPQNSGSKPSQPRLAKALTITFTTVLCLALAGVAIQLVTSNSAKSSLTNVTLRGKPETTNFLGFGVTWSESEAHAASPPNIGVTCTTLQLQTTASGSACYVSPWPTASKSGHCAGKACTLWRSDLSALAELHPAVVSTDIAIDWFATCNRRDQLEIAWRSPLWRNEVTVFTALKRLKIPVIVTVSPTPAVVTEGKSEVPQTCLAYPDPRFARQSQWDNAAEDLLSELVVKDGFSNIAYFGGLSEPNSQDLLTSSPLLTAPTKLEQRYLGTQITYRDWQQATASVGRFLLGHAGFNGHHGSALVRVLGPSVSDPSASDSGASGWGCPKTNKASSQSTTTTDSAAPCWVKKTGGDHRLPGYGASDWHQYAPATGPAPSGSCTTGQSPTLAAETEGYAELHEMGEAGDTQFAGMAADAAALGSADRPTFITEVGIKDFGGTPKNCDSAYTGTGITTNAYAVAMFDFGLRLASDGVDSGLAWSLDSDITNATVPGAGMLSDTAKSGAPREPWFTTWQALTAAFPAGSRIYDLSAPANILGVADERAAACGCGNDVTYAFADLYPMKSAVASPVRGRPVTIKGPAGYKYVTCQFNASPSSPAAWSVKAHHLVTTGPVVVPLDDSSATIVQFYPSHGKPTVCES